MSLPFVMVVLIVLFIAAVFYRTWLVGDGEAPPSTHPITQASESAHGLLPGEHLESAKVEEFPDLEIDPEWSSSVNRQTEGS